MKLLARTDADILLEFDPTLRHMLFVDGEVRYPRMAPLKWSGESRNMEMDIAGLMLLGVKLHKFQIAPFAIHSQEFVDLTMVATFAPDGRETAILAEQVGEDITAKITPGPELDLAPKEEGVRAAARKLHDQLVEDGATLTITSPDGDSVTLGEQDDLYPQAVDIVRSTGRTSITHLQRQLHIGHNRAARLLEDMEKAGVVTAMDASGQRDVVAA